MWHWIPTREERILNFCPSRHRWLYRTLSLPPGRRKDTSSGGIIKPWPLALFRIKMNTGAYFQQFCPRSPQRRRALFSGRGQAVSAGFCRSLLHCSPVSVQRSSPFRLSSGGHFRNSASNVLQERGLQSNLLIATANSKSRLHSSNTLTRKIWSFLALF